MQVRIFTIQYASSSQNPILGQINIGTLVHSFGTLAHSFGTLVHNFGTFVHIFGTLVQSFGNFIYFLVLWNTFWYIYFYYTICNLFPPKKSNLGLRYITLVKKVWYIILVFRHRILVLWYIGLVLWHDFWVLWSTFWYLFLVLRYIFW